MNQDEAAELATVILRGITRGLRGERSTREDFEPGDPGEFFADDLPPGETVEIVERERIVRITNREERHATHVDAELHITDSHAPEDPDETSGSQQRDEESSDRDYAGRCSAGRTEGIQDAAGGGL